MIRQRNKRVSIVIFALAVLVFTFLPSMSVFAGYFGQWVTMASDAKTDLNGIWGAASTDVFAVGSSGTIMHYDGKAWSPMVSGTTGTLNGVWGAASTDVFAVGSSGTIVHYDGKIWSLMVSGTTANLNGIWGSASADVFAVGSSGTIVHYDGKTWSPMVSGTTGTLNGVWGSASADVFAVGSSGVIIHYDGKAWSPMTRNVTSDLLAVWGLSASDVFCVGSTSTIFRYAPPNVTSVSPGEGSQSATLDVSIGGSNFAGATEVRFGAGIAVNSFTVPSSNLIMVNITIVPGATIGARDVSVTTPGGTSTLSGSFLVKQALPVITSVSPDQGNQETKLNVNIAGTNFTGATEVRFGPGVTINSFTVPSSNLIIANITIVAGATTGARDVSVTTPGGTSTLSNSFTVKQALPIITLVSPDQGSQGATLDVNITGANFTGATEVRFGQGTATNSFTVPNPNLITANITIVAGATTGARDVSVTTPGGSSTLSGSFIVKQALPIITLVSPDQGSRGEALDVIISGSNLNGVSAVDFGSEVEVISFTNLSPTQIATRIAIDRNATVGVRHVSVTTTGGTSTFSGSFTVKEEPLGTLFIAFIWVGIALIVVLFWFILRVIRHQRAASL